MTDEHDVDTELEPELQDEFEEAGFDGEIDTEALLADAEARQLQARAYWHLLPKQNFTFLFANCLFFAGALCAWTRAIPEAWYAAADMPVKAFDPSMNLIGLDTIRGSFIFALAVFGFFQIALNIMSRTTKVWPFFLNAIIALEVGVVGLKNGLNSEAYEMSKAWLEKADSKTMLDDLLTPLSSIAPAYWLLTLGGMIVVIVLINGLMSGAKSAKMAAADEGASRRRR